MCALKVVCRRFDHPLRFQTWCPEMSLASSCGLLHSVISRGACQNGALGQPRVTDTTPSDCGSHLNSCAASMTSPRALIHLKWVRLRRWLIPREGPLPYDSFLTFRWNFCRLSSRQNRRPSSQSDARHAVVLHGGRCFFESSRLLTTLRAFSW